MTKPICLAALLVAVAGCGGSGSTSPIEPGEYVMCGSQPYYVDEIVVADGKELVWCIETFGAEGYPFNCHATAFNRQELRRDDDARRLFETYCQCKLNVRTKSSASPAADAKGRGE